MQNFQPELVGVEAWRSLVERLFSKGIADTLWLVHGGQAEAELFDIESLAVARMRDNEVGHFMVSQFSRELWQEARA